MLHTSDSKNKYQLQGPQHTLETDSGWNFTNQKPQLETLQICSDWLMVP